MGEVRTWILLGSLIAAFGCSRGPRSLMVPEHIIYSPQQVSSSDVVSDLHLVQFADQSWTEEQLQTHIREAAQVYAQCGLRFTNITVTRSPLVSRDLSRWKPDSQRGYITFGKRAATGVRHPAVFLIDGFSDAEGTPFALANYGIGTVPPEELWNTVFFPSYVNSDEFAQDRQNSPYSSLAHELMHLFTRDGQHNNDQHPNLLTIWRRRTNHITADQCRDVRASDLVRPAANSVTEALNRAGF